MEIYKKSQILSSLNDEQKISHQSKHLLLELYRCDREKLNDESFLRCNLNSCLLYTSPSPRDISGSRMPSSA